MTSTSHNSAPIRSALAARKNSHYQNSQSQFKRRSVTIQNNNDSNNNNSDQSSCTTNKAIIKSNLRGGAKDGNNDGSPPGWLKWAYRAAGASTTAAWSNCVYTAIRSNQPPGAIMPNWQHGFFARVGALSAVPLVLASYTTLVKASSSCNWGELSSPSSRRQNLALVAATGGSALWVSLAHIITRIPGTDGASHIGLSGPSSLPRGLLIGAYGSAAALSAAVWVRSLPENVRTNPLKWPGRVVDGVAQSLVSLGPKMKDNPVCVKYSLLSGGFLFFTGLQLVGQHPLTVIPSWTSRRLARAFPAWTLLAGVAAFDLKEATENGQLLANKSYRVLSNGIKGMGCTYLVARAGAMGLDSTWPGTYGAVTAVPGWAALAMGMMAYTLRSDDKNIP